MAKFYLPRTLLLALVASLALILPSCKQENGCGWGCKTKKRKNIKRVSKTSKKKYPQDDDTNMYNDEMTPRRRS